ncbi:MAG: Lrp/AsnC family transcriptional regulator [Pseudomonadota bacterium]
MDETDRNILRHLAENGKLTQGRLAEKVGLSLSSCQRRVKSLEQDGAITGYRALISPALLGEGLVVLVGINLERHARKDIQAFQAAIVRLSMVKEVHHIAGAYDYFLKVAVEDVAAYENFHADDLAAIPGIARITSFVAMSTFKD